MMTSRERWLAAIQLQPLDHLPFWPKISGAYTRIQKAPYDTMAIDELFRWTESDPQIGIPGVVRDVRRHSSLETTRDGDYHHATYKIGAHQLTATSQFDAGSQSWHPTVFPIKSAADLPILADWFRDGTVEFDPDGLEQSKARKAEVGETGITCNGIGESPLMNFVEHLAGVELAHYLLIDAQEEVENLFDAIHQDLLRRAEITCTHGIADLNYMVENTSTTLISPDQYRQYCFRHIGEYAAIAKAHDRHMVLHMCGHLKLLLPQLEQLPVAAFEAFTSPTVGNTTLLDGRQGCPTKCLIGGTNAWLWTRSEAEIRRTIEHDLDQLPHTRGIVVTSAGVMPPICPPATIRAISRFVSEYPVRN